MSPPTHAPHAADISVVETLGLLDGPFREMADGVAHDQYAIWLGSGISFSRMPGLALVAKAALNFLQRRTNAADADCRFGKSLKAILGLAGLSRDEWARIDFARPVDEWPDVETITRRLVLNYARMLDLPPDGEMADFLVWDAIDVVGIYGDPAKLPDAEHISVAALVMEGVASDIASANWDGLIERAVDDLSGGAALLRVCVRPEDARKPALRANLYKFHGCAVLAGQNPSLYRDKLVGRQSQINGWAVRGENAVIAAKLIDMVTSKPTLMLGLSAQDSNIQGIFVEAEQRMAWPWPSHPPAYVFSENTLGIDQLGLLQNVYHAHYSPATRQAIYDSALLRAFAKPLLTALWLHVVCAKLGALLDQAPGHLSRPDKDALRDGIIYLRDIAASTASPDAHEAFIRGAIARSGYVMALFRDGQQPATGDPVYRPISSLPLQHLGADPSIPISGLSELAVALGLIGMAVSAGDWTLAVTDPTLQKAGALQIQTASTSAEVFFAANSQSALRLFVNGHVAENDNAIVMHSHELPLAMSRSPRTAPGRIGRVGLREVSIAELVAGANRADELLQRLREEVAL